MGSDLIEENLYPGFWALQSYATLQAMVLQLTSEVGAMT